MIHRGGMSSGLASQARAAGRADSPLIERLRHKRGYHESRHSSSSGQPVFCDDGKRHVCAGHLNHGVFTKQVAAAHMLRTPPAIAVQQEVLNELQRRGCVTVRAELYDGRILSAPLSAFCTHGLIVDRGFGKQRALPLVLWTDANSPQEVLPL